MQRKVLVFTLLTILISTLFAPSAQAVQNVDRMSEQQLIALLDSYIKHTIKVRELAVRKKQNLLWHKVLSVKKLPKEIIKSFSDVSDYEQLGKPFLVFYTAVDYKVAEESKYRMNGINYRLVIMVKKNRDWEFADYTMAPVHKIVEAAQGFGTEDEKQMAKITQLHYQGIYVNREGKKIGDLNSDNAATEGDLRYEITGEADSVLEETPSAIPNQVNPNYKRPKWIRVVMKDERNMKYYGCTRACVQRLDFLDYLKHVLPFEWEKEAHPQALKTGALAVKMYGWHAVTVDPKARFMDADIDDTTNNQKYVADFSKLSQRERILAEKVGEVFHQEGVAGVGVKENVFDNLVDIGHKKSGAARSGIVSQVGSDRLAKTKKMTHTEIIRHYVEGSSQTPEGGKVEFFRYAK